MTEADLQEAIAVTGFDPRELFLEDGITFRSAGELREHLAVERVDEEIDAAGHEVMHVKFKNPGPALTALAVYLELLPVNLSEDQ